MVFWYFIWPVSGPTSASRQQWLVTAELSKWVKKRRSCCSLVLPFRVSSTTLPPEHYQLPGLLKCLRWMRTLVALARWESTWKLIRVPAWEKENSSAHFISCFDCYPFDDILTGKWHLNFSQSEQNCIMHIAYGLGTNQRDLLVIQDVPDDDDDDDDSDDGKRWQWKRRWWWRWWRWW